MVVEKPDVRVWPLRIIASALAIIGLAMGGGGALLLSLGGSGYYLLGGLAVLASAILLWRRSPWGIHIYALFLAATLIWALWEEGFDGWGLAPRLIAPSIIGLLLGLGAVRRPLRNSGATSHSALSAFAAAVFALLLVAGVAIGTSGPPSVARTALSRPVTVAGDPGEWPQFGRTAAGDRYSPLAQITPANVGGLKPAWIYHTGVEQGLVKSSLEVTPIMVGDTMYLCTQTNVVIALDPETGRQKWRFDPQVDRTGASAVTACRGVAYFRATGATDCPERIISATFDARLIALDAHTGRLCRSFGNGGSVDLLTGLGSVIHGFYYASSAPTIVRGRIVLGGWVADDQSLDVPSGVIRAYDATTGRFAWAWDAAKPDDHAEPAAGASFTRSTPNSWAPMSADEQLGLVYVPTGNPAVDHWGGARSAASEKFGSSLIALDAETGGMRWSYQTAHHDLWDYDVGSQPTLFDFPTAAGPVPAVAQATKRGELFVLDRRTGAPLTSVVERPAPQRGAVPSERLAKSQPFSVGMPDFAGPPLREANMWGLTPIDQLWCRIAFRRLRYDGPATPPGTDRALIYPSIGGGMNWGGVSLDPGRNLMMVNSIYYGTIVQLVPRAEADRLIAASKGQMHNYALPQPQVGAPYGVLLTGFDSPLGVPCNQPPYGRLGAVDLATRTLLWSRPIGSGRDTGPFRIASHLPLPMGMPMFGGSLTTASGLVFIGATQDRTFRALDSETGRILWSARLPGGGQANPMSYVSRRSGRQFVVIAAGGHVMLHSPLSDAIVAYALPTNR